MRLRIWLLIFLALSIFACGVQPASVEMGPGDHVREVEVDGRSRTYILHIPPGFDSEKPTPVVLVFHGGGGNAESAINMTGFSDKTDQENFIAVYPNGSGRFRNKLLTWNGGNCCAYAQESNVDDVAFIAVLLDDLSAVVQVDEQRVYATGMSNGGIMSYRLACELSDRIAAIGPVSGTMNLDICQPEQPVSVIHFHGADDQHLPYEGGVGTESLVGVNFNSVADSIDFWREHNQCRDTAVSTQVGPAAHESYAGCDGETAVELYTIADEGHTWPGGQPGWGGGDILTQEISATDVIWDFFTAHPMRDMQ